MVAMARISLHQSSFIRLSVLFSALIALALFLFIKEVQMVGPGSDASSVTLRLLIIVLLLIAVGMFLLSLRVNKRINRILRTADRIMQTGDLSSRVRVEQRTWGDLHTLSLFINDMLSQIEESVAATRHVSDSIAHDLRTPLTRLRNRMEVLQYKPCGAEDYAEQMQQVINECDGLLATFNGMLRISRIETERKKDRFTQFNLAHVMEDVTELYEPLAQEKQQRFEASFADAPIYGDRDLLFQCFANLLDNAVKYTPEGGQVQVKVAVEEGKVQACIRDSGRGIVDEKKEKVFRRFYRVDETRGTPGNGLGLSLVAAVIKLHKGKIALKNNEPNGLLVQVCLPVSVS